MEEVAHMPPSGSSWSVAFFGGAALVILFKAWRGWRLGVVRQVAALVAMGAAGAAGALGGAWLAPVLHSLWPGPDRLLAVLGSILLATTVFLVITVVSTIVFKKTEHQSMGMVRIGYGLSGALIGAGYGILLVWMAVLGARLIGTVAEAQLALEKNARLRTASAPKSSPASPLIGGLAELKQSLEHGTVGALVAQVDPIPDRVYATLGKMSRMVSQPSTMERFARFPGIRPLLDQPEARRLAQRPADQPRSHGARLFYAPLESAPCRGGE